MTFTEAHRTIILNALDAQVASNNRTKAKQPRFAQICDREIFEIRQAQEIVRGWATNPPEKTK